MDFVEILVPIAFLVLFGVGKLVEKLQGKSPDDKRPVRQEREDGEEESVKRGGILEEIRRRIEERIVIASEKPAPPRWIEQETESETVIPVPAPPPSPRVRKRELVPAPPIQAAQTISRRSKLELRGAVALRRALLHREILGPPVALRREGEGII